MRSEPGSGPRAETSGFTLEEAPIPVDLDGPHGDDFRAMVDVRND